MTEKHLTDQRFSDFHLADSLKRGLLEANFEFCTPIQALSLPHLLSGTDVAGQAQTGTGKTAAFLLACCQHLITHPVPPAAPLTAPPDRPPRQVRAMILAPTRELAIQIHKDAKTLAKHTDLKLGLAYGGTGYEEQKRILEQGVDILIGTPGRLIDFFKQSLFNLQAIQVVVLDEADRMFDLGFIKDIRYLLRKMPHADKRLNMLFSATLSYRVMELAYEHMNNPQEIKVESDTPVADRVLEFSYYPADSEKLPLLVNLLKRDQLERVVVFVNTRHAAENVSSALEANGIPNATLSGDVPQRKREKLLEGFKRGDQAVLVATDVAARGLHIPEVSHVFNFDLPRDADDYIHRIGRTARAGASGEAISFVCEKYAYSIMDIEEHIGHSIPRKDIDDNLLQPIIQPRPTSTEKKKEAKPRSGRKSREKSAESLKNKSSLHETSAGRKKAEVSDNVPVLEKVPYSLSQTPPEVPIPGRFSRRFGEVPAIG